MTSHLDSHTTTDVKPDMLSGVQTGSGIPHDRYNIRGIAHARTNKKDDIFMQRRLDIDEAHTALDIFRFAAFFNKNICPILAKLLRGHHLYMYLCVSVRPLPVPN